MLGSWICEVYDVHVSSMSHRFRKEISKGQGRRGQGTREKINQNLPKLTKTKQNQNPNNQMNARYHLLISVGSLLSTAASFVLPSVGTSATACSMSSMKQTAADMDIISPTTLGPTILSKLVQDASITSQSLDMSGIVWLEHLNLVVGDMDVAMKFYVDFMGFSRDSNPKHVNLGQQQFHLAATGEPAQRITGSIGLTVPSLQSIKDRIPHALTDLEGTLFAINDESDDKIISITCPYGNIFNLYDISIDDDYSSTIDATSQSNHKMVNMHALGGAYGAHRLAVRLQPGIRYVEMACPVSTASSIAEFYQTVMKCNQVITTTLDGHRECAIVGVGPGVHFVFVESSELTARSLERMQGVHACIYIPHFESTYHELKIRGLIWTNPRFTHLDTCDTWEEAFASRTLRFKDVLDVKTGDKVLELEHETRPMSHGQYLKVPNYTPN